MGRVTVDRLAGCVDIDKDRRRLQLVLREKEGLIEVAGGLGGRRVIVFFIPRLLRCGMLENLNEAGFRLRYHELFLQ
jgi:hypothetical protein